MRKKTKWTRKWLTRSYESKDVDSLHKQTELLGLFGDSLASYLEIR